MPDIIVYTYTSPKSEFHPTPTKFAAASKEGLKAEVTGSWADYREKDVEATVVDSLKEAKEILRGLTPTQKLVLSLHKELIK